MSAPSAASCTMATEATGQDLDTPLQSTITTTTLLATSPNAGKPCVWFINDETETRRHSVEVLLPDIPVFLRSIQSQTFTTRHMVEQLQQDLLVQSPTLLWIRVPGVNTITNQKARYKLDNIASLSQLQHKLGRHVFIEIAGTLANEYMKDSLTQLQWQKVKWCNLAVKHSNGRPAGMCTYTLHNMQLPKLEECQCLAAASDHIHHSNKRTDNTREWQHMTEQFHNSLGVILVKASSLPTTNLPHHSPPSKISTHRQFTIPIPDTTTQTTPLPPYSNQAAGNTLRFPPIGPEEVIRPMPEPSLAFPTEARIRQKEKEKQAKLNGTPIEKKTRFKVIEAGTDDMGEDFSSLGDYDECFYDAGQHTSLEASFLINDFVEPFLVDIEASMAPHYWLHGSEAVDPTRDPAVLEYATMEAFLNDYDIDADDHSHIDVVEICGGCARTSEVLIRRWHQVKVGMNFDAVVGFDLLDLKQRADMWRYLKKAKPLVIVLATPCTGLAGWKGINAARGSETHFRNRAVSLELGELGADIAEWQLNGGRHYVAENPKGSELFRLPKWKKLDDDPRTASADIDMCAAGMQCPDTKMLVKKGTTLKASCEALLATLRKFRCNGQHPHKPIEGKCKDGENLSHKCRIWPWKLATELAASIAALIRWHYQYVTSELYPETSTQADPPAKRRSNRLDWPCPACRSNLPKDHPKHNRDLQGCRWPHDRVDFECPGCASGRARHDRSHTYDLGKCRWASVVARQAKPRQGHHPRDPRRPATTDPTAGLQPDPTADTVEEPGEVIVEDRTLPPQDDDDYRHPDAAGSSAQPLGYRLPPARVIAPRTTAPRTRTTFRESGDQDSTTGIEWSTFDLGRSLQLLRSHNEGVVRRTLRMLHIRWWHVAAKRMSRILQAAGVPEKALRMIQDIVDTCRPCRMWKKPGPSNAATSRLVEGFNKVVQHDLMFVSPTPGKPFNQKDDRRAEPWQHMIDACTRLTQAQILDEKTSEAILQGMEYLWIRPYGPPAKIESDQESGLITEEAKVYLLRLGIELVEKGVGAHVRMLEVHHHILRQTFLKLVAQAHEEGIRATNNFLLTCAVTAKNALFTVGSSTPLQATFGTQPAILPDIEQVTANIDDSNTGPDGISRGRLRLKELACQDMIEVTAQERMKRAASSKTRPSVAATGLEVGEIIEFYREPAQKEHQGWRGPAEILKLEKDGTVHVKWQGGSLICRLQDVRRALTYLAMMYSVWAYEADGTSSSLDFIQSYMATMPTGTQTTVAVLMQTGKYVVTTAAKQQPLLLQHLLYFAGCDLHLTGCIGARLARGLPKLSGLRDIDDSLVVSWPHSRPKSFSYARIPGNSNIDLRQITTDAKTTYVVQLLLRSLDEIEFLRVQFPNIPHLGHPEPIDAEMACPGIEREIPTIPPHMDTSQPRPRGRSEDSQGSTNPTPHVSRRLEDLPSKKRDRSTDSRGSDNPAPFVSPCLPKAENVPLPDTDSDDDIADDEEMDGNDGNAYFLSTPPEQLRLEDHLAVNDHFAYLEGSGFNDHDDDGEVEFYITSEMAHWCDSCPRELAEGEVLCFLINKHRVSAVIKRDVDNLTPEEQEKFKPLVEEAQLDELRRWNDLKVFRRGKRSESRNPVDGTWVLKWKYVKVKDSSGKEVEKRIVKARLTARGFKDIQAYAENIATFSGTSSKSAQRAINGFVAQHEYVLFSMDISAAFLKGLTFQEIAELTGEPLRSVQFVMPPGCVHLLRRLPGLEDFDPITEILDFLKAMWGLKDAPRAFGLRRDQTLREFGARPTVKDPNMWIKIAQISGSPKVVCSFSTHLDDIKGGATESEREKLIALLKRDFGNDLKVNLRVFEFTGIKHTQNADYSIYVHQDHYVADLSVIPVTKHHGEDAEGEVNEAESQAFDSLLGALAWLLMTRADIAAYVGYLQRLARKPRRKHLHQINAVLKYCKRQSTGIMYRKLSGQPSILVVADSAYQANEDKTECIASRGYFIFLAFAVSDTEFEVQLLDFTSRKLQVISRSAFAAEMRNALEAAQDGINHSIMMHDIYRGPISAEEAARLRDTGTHFLSTILLVDSFGLYTATTKEEPSPGTDSSMLFHVKALRHLLDNNNVSVLGWIDNRDMIGDGLTKGKPSREDMNAVLNTGKWTRLHAAQFWRSKAKRRPEPVQL